MNRLILSILALGYPAGSTIIVAIPTASGILVASDSRHVLGDNTAHDPQLCDSWQKVFISSRPQTVYALHGDVDLYRGPIIGDPCKIAPVFSIKNAMEQFLSSLNHSNPLTKETLLAIARDVSRKILEFDKKVGRRQSWNFSIIIATATPTLSYGVAMGGVNDANELREPKAAIRDASPDALSDFMVEALSTDFVSTNILIPLQSSLLPLIGHRISTVKFKTALNAAIKIVETATKASDKLPVSLIGGSVQAYLVNSGGKPQRIR
jgi:hypothetical protein